MSDASLKARLQQTIKDAMRAGDKPRLGVLRMAHAAIRQREIDERVELDDAGVTEVLTKLVKQRRESIEQYRDAGRDDLADAEAAEIGVLEEFLPAPLSEAELEALIDEAISEAGAESMKQMGQVMGHLKPRVTGRADMAEVSARVKARLGG